MPSWPFPMLTCSVSCSVAGTRPGKSAVVIVYYAAGAEVVVCCLRKLRWWSDA